jgi:hypothetical protein
MIFARYIGRHTEGSDFTPGKLYVASPLFEDGTAVVDSSFKTVDDSGKEFIFDVSDTMFFDFPKNEYAVVLKPVGKLKTGQVVQVTGVDGDFYQIAGEAYFSSSVFDLIDSTTLMIGAVLFHIATSCWTRVLSIREDGLVTTTAGTYPIMEYRFAVGSGEVLFEPEVTCQNNEGVESELTVGKVYHLLFGSPEEKSVSLVNDRGVLLEYMFSRFSFDF